MKKYDAYKDSGIEWIGKIPEHWKVSRLKFISHVKRGASPRPIEDPIYFDENGEYAWVRIADVTASERYLNLTTQRLSDLGASLSVKQEPGDFFLSIAGSVGKPIITNIKCCIHDGFVWFPDLKIDAEWLYYIFLTGLPYLGLGKLGTQLNLNTETVGNITIPIPPEEYINDIINYLDRKTSEIDSLIEKKKQLIVLLQEERTAIINHAVTKGIDPNVKLKNSGIEWIGEIPEHWEVKRMKYLVKEKLKYGANESSEYENPEYPRYIRITDFGTNGKLKKNTFKSLPPEVANNYLLENGDILFARSGATVGKTFFFESHKGQACFAGYLIKASFDKSKVNPKLPYYYTKTTFYENWKQSIFQQATIQNIGADKYNQLLISISPDVAEQNEIINYIEKRTSEIDNLIYKVNKEIELLEEYKIALISEVVTGKVDVREEVVN